MIKDFCNSGISIIIPTHKRSEKLSRLLRSIEISSLELNVSFEVVVVSNLEDLKTSNVILFFEKRLNIKFFVTHKIGVNFARNLGLAKSSNDICFFLDDDCQLIDSNWYKKILNGFDNGASAFGGMLVPYGKMTFSGAAYYINIASWLKRYSLPGNMESLRLVGACMAFSKLRLNGLNFDDTIAFGGSENSLIISLVDRRDTIFLDKTLEVYHDFNISFFELIKKGYMQGKQHFRMSKFAHQVLVDQKLSFTEIQRLEIQALKGINRFVLNFFLFAYRLSFNFHTKKV